MALELGLFFSRKLEVSQWGEERDWVAKKRGGRNQRGLNTKLRIIRLSEVEGSRKRSFCTFAGKKLKGVAQGHGLFCA